MLLLHQKENVGLFNDWIFLTFVFVELYNDFPHFTEGFFVVSVCIKDLVYALKQLDLYAPPVNHYALLELYLRT